MKPENKKAPSKPEFFQASFSTISLIAVYLRGSIRHPSSTIESIEQTFSISRSMCQKTVRFQIIALNLH